MTPTEPGVLDLAEMRRVAESPDARDALEQCFLALIDQLEANRQGLSDQIEIAAKALDRAEASEARLAQVEEALVCIRDSITAATTEKPGPHELTLRDGTVVTGPLVDQVHELLGAVASVAAGALSPSNPETQDGTR